MRDFCIYIGGLLPVRISRSQCQNRNLTAVRDVHERGRAIVRAFDPIRESAISSTVYISPTGPLHSTNRRVEKLGNRSAIVVAPRSDQQIHHASHDDSEQLSQVYSTAQTIAGPPEPERLASFSRSRRSRIGRRVAPCRVSPSDRWTDRRELWAARRQLFCLSTGVQSPPTLQSRTTVGFNT